MPNVNRRHAHNLRSTPYSATHSRDNANGQIGATEATLRRSRRLSGAAAEDAVRPPTQEVFVSQTLPRLPPGSSSSSYTSSMRSTASPEWHGAEQPIMSAADETHQFGLRTAWPVHSAPMNFRPDSDPMTFALSFLLARIEQRINMAAEHARARGVDPHAPMTLPQGSEMFHGMSPDRALYSGLSWEAALPEGLSSSGSFYFGRSPPPERSALSIGVDKALQNIAKWYGKLPSTRTVHITQAQAAEHQCPISFAPFSEMDHPVSVRSSHVLRVYEAVDLLTWMQSSLSLDPDREHATNPLNRSPLTLEMLGRVEVKQIKA